MTRPLLLDLFCGAGGACKGYQDAGFEVVGVDIKPQPRYVGEWFVLGDGLDVLRNLLGGGCLMVDMDPPTAFTLDDFTAIHASPPCQGETRVVLKADRNNYPRLIEPTRELLQQTNKPYVIENVEGAPVVPWVKLCGSMFGLPLIRHRWFETSFLILQPRHARHMVSTHNGALARYNKLDDGAPFVTVAGHLCNTRDASIAMGIDWMVKAELVEAIPPAYTHFIGQQLLKHVTQAHRPKKATKKELSYDNHRKEPFPERAGSAPAGQKQPRHRRPVGSEPRCSQQHPQGGARAGPGRRHRCEDRPL